MSLQVLLSFPSVQEEAPGKDEESWLEYSAMSPPLLGCLPLPCHLPQWQWGLITGTSQPRCPLLEVSQAGPSQAAPAFRSPEAASIWPAHFSV